MTRNYSVYFVTEEESNLTKVGFTKIMEKRLDDLQVGNPRKLWVSARIDGLSLQSARSMEIYLHKRFKEHHVRGEWFTDEIFYVNWFSKKFKFPRDVRINLIDLPIA